MESENQQNKTVLKKAICILMTVLMLFSTFGGTVTAFATDDHGAVVETGSCGANVTYVLYDDGTLVISGTGNMNDYGDGCDSPFYDVSPFCDNTDIKTVVIENGVTSIGSYAFLYCRSITSITIPDSVTGIGEWAFSSTAYYNDENNWENDVLYIGNHLIEAKNDISGSYSVKSGTKTIADSAFARCESLTSITIPDSVTSIGSYAFCYCESLTSITIPESLTSIGKSAFDYTDYYNDKNNWENDVLYIGNHLIMAKEDISGSYSVKSGTKTIADYAFYVCESLKSITIPEGVTSIGERAFRYCESLKSITIPEGVTSLGSYAFDGCYCLTSIEIPDSVTSIGDSAFYWCDSLTSIVVDENNNYYSSDEYGVLFNKDKTVLIQYPIGKSITEYTIPEGVASIGSHAFYDCESLTSVTIPDSVTSIGDYAFWSLTSITILNPECKIYDSKDTISSIATIYGYANSTAQAYAEKYDRNFVMLCAHVNGSQKEAVDPTCTTDGHTAGIKCDDCGEWLSGEVIKAGHKDENSDNICDVCEGNLLCDILPGETKTIEVDEDEITYLKFIPNVSGVYTFTSNADYDTYGYLFNADKDEITSDDDGAENGNFKITYELQAGETYYFGARFYSSSRSGSFDVALTCDEVYESTTQTNEGTGIIVNYDYGVFAENATLVVNTMQGNANIVFGDTYSKYVSYDIHFELGDKTVQPNGSVTVKMPIPDGYNTDFLAVYYIDDVGNSTKLDSRCTNGYVVFDTNHFSEYVIVDESSTHTHSYSSKITKAATCTATGTKIFTCSCGDSYTEPIAKLDHTEVKVSGKAATCTATGLTDGKKCSVCETVTVVQKEIAALGHKWVAATCTDAKTCSTCKVTEGAALGHNWVAATCTDAKTCSTCKATEGDALGHNWVAATCTAAKTCSTCKATEGKALGHKEVAVPGKAATCTEKGLTEGKKCSVCGVITVAQKEIPATGHKEVALPAKAATYTADGLTAGKKCSVCGVVTVAQKKVARKTLGKVKNLKVKETTTSTVKLSWSKVTGAESYKVYYSTNGKSWKSVKATKNTATVKKLKSGTSYQFKVKAVAGKYSGTTSSVVKTATKVAKATVKSVKSSKKNTAVVTWKKVTGASGYVVEYSTSKKFTSKTTKKVTFKKGSTTKTTLKKLKSGTKYYVRVKAYKTVNGKAVYGSVSTAKTVKVK